MCSDTAAAASTAHANHFPRSPQVPEIPGNAAGLMKSEKTQKRSWHVDPRYFIAQIDASIGSS